MFGESHIGGISLRDVDYEYEDDENAVMAMTEQVSLTTDDFGRPNLLSGQEGRQLLDLHRGRVQLVLRPLTWPTLQVCGMTLH